MLTIGVNAVVTQAYVNSQDDIYLATLTVKAHADGNLVPVKSYTSGRLGELIICQH